MKRANTWHPLLIVCCTSHPKARPEVFILRFCFYYLSPVSNLFINKQITKFIPPTLIKTIFPMKCLRGISYLRCWFGLFTRSTENHTHNPNTLNNYSISVYKGIRDDKEKQKHLFTLSWLIEASCVCVWIDSSTVFNRIESNQRKIWISKVLWMITCR